MEKWLLLCECYEKKKKSNGTFLTRLKPFGIGICSILQLIYISVQIGDVFDKQRCFTKIVKVPRRGSKKKKTRHIRFQDQTRVAKLNFHMSPVKSNDKVANTNHSVFLGNQISCNLPGFISTPVSF